MIIIVDFKRPEYRGCCGLAGCLDYIIALIEEEYYDCESKSRPDWCPLKLLPKYNINQWKSQGNTNTARCTVGIGVLMKSQENHERAD